MYSMPKDLDSLVSTLGMRLFISPITKIFLYPLDSSSCKIHKDSNEKNGESREAMYTDPKQKPGLVTIGNQTWSLARAISVT